MGDGIDYKADWEAAMDALSDRTREMWDAQDELARVKWVVEVHLSRHGLWDKQVGLEVRAAWLVSDGWPKRKRANTHETETAPTEARTQ